MPTVLRIGALRVAIYPNDHRPAHVHVIGNGCEAVFVLEPDSHSVTLRENYGFDRRAIAMLERTLATKLNQLKHAWEQIHGAD